MTASEQKIANILNILDTMNEDEVMQFTERLEEWSKKFDLTQEDIRQLERSRRQ